MGDTRKHKYKGKVCSPPAATAAEHKQTKNWCKGKVGREHVPVVLYNAKLDKNWGLATEATERCEVCDKLLRSSWELPQPTHDFEEMVSTIAYSKDMWMDTELLALRGHLKLRIQRGIEAMRHIADKLGVQIVIEVHEKGSRRGSWGRHVRVSTGQESDVD